MIGYIKHKEFRSGLGIIMHDDVLADALFNAMDDEKDGKIDFREYVNGLAVLMKGSLQEQISCTCTMQI